MTEKRTTSYTGGSVAVWKSGFTMMFSKRAAILIVVLLSTAGVRTRCAGVGGSESEQSTTADADESETEEFELPGATRPVESPSNTEGEGQLGAAAQGTQQPASTSRRGFSFGLPVGPVRRSGPQFLGGNAGLFVQQLQTDYPDLVGTVQGILSWAQDRLPQTAEEAERFLEAVDSARVFVDSAAQWIFESAPPSERDAAYTRFFQTTGGRLPKSFYDAASATNTEISQFFSTATSAAGAAPQQISVSPWRELRASISKKHGPVTNMPYFVSLSDKCPVGDNKIADVAKATQDVTHRLTLLTLDRVSKEGTRGKAITPQLAAFCAALGGFLAGWQQHQQLAQEGANAPKAHGQLISNLKDAHKTILRSFENSGEKDSASYKKRKQELRKLSNSSAMKQCSKYIFAAGSAATQPFRVGDVIHAARSLYGGIANSVSVQLTNVETAIRAFLAFALKNKKGQGPQKLAALCAVMHISGRMKACFMNASNLSTVSLYHLHFDGSTFLKRVAAVDRSFAPEEVSQYICNAGAHEAAIDEIFRNIFAVVTPAWERENMHERLNHGEGGATSSSLPAQTEKSNTSTSEESDASITEL